ncbi:family 78 glycoside hydrolase catalytic domain [Rubrolithibacter danxiaensis]|uniref:family 78 glycoside hydrolase catalytic domain n=1 Tax=Rubrolithibacter danxiaensis TaxID=3390805 RepID=UPI003BF7F275
MILNLKIPAIKQIKFYILLVVFSFVYPLIIKASSPLIPQTLTCEYRENPLGIDIQKPRLGWMLSSAQRNQVQNAYEIIVSSNLNGTEAIVWESGKVTSSESLHIEYAGNPLKPFTRYYWKVRVFDQKGQVSDWSAVAWFETAMLKESDWQAKWIGDGSKQFERDEDFYQNDPMPLFKKEINAIKKVASARLYISGLGYYEAFINGEKIGDNVLDPGFTTYSKQDLYSTYDITSQVKTGKNIFGVMLGNGWYNPLPLQLFGRYNIRDVQQTGRPVLKAQILIKYADGTKEQVNTDETWLTAPGPILRNSIYLGEHYDARLERSDWFVSNSTGWKKAAIAKGPSGILTAQMQPPVRVTKVLKPVEITEVGKDTFIVDMGQNFAGVARIKVKGPTGSKITLRYGEDIHPDGRLNFLTTVAGHIKEMWNLKGGPGAPKTAWQEDSYTLKGKGTEIWAPRFTFHGFRYVEVTGWPGKPTLNDIEGLRMNSDLDSNGTFSSSNQMFNKLHEVIKWTFLSNVFSVQSDCPGREKMGYGADIVVTSPSYIYNFNMANFYRKTVRDFANEQLPAGGITEIAPSTGIAVLGIGDKSGPLGWQLAFPYVQKQLYEYYGDKRIIEENYPAFRRQIDFINSKAVDGLFYWDISDHEALDPKPEAFTASAFYYHHVLLVSEFAGILGKKQDSVNYAALAEKIKNAIVKKFLIPGTGRFDNATQSAQIFALWYNFSPEKEASFKVLMDEFARHNWHIATGIFSTQMMFDILRERDQNDIAYRLANHRDFPGWGYMLSKGATTLWETWAYPDNAASQNHPMFGSIEEWFYKSLLGINSAAPAFKKIIIKPQPAGDLTWAKGSYQSVRGKIVSDWKKDKENFHLKVSVPANTTAEIWIPSKNNGELQEGGKDLKASGVKFVRYEKGYAVISVGSGDYNFSSQL